MEQTGCYGLLLSGTTFNVMTNLVNSREIHEILIHMTDNMNLVQLCAICECVQFTKCSQFCVLWLELGLALGLGSNICKLHMHDFETAQRIFQIEQIDKSPTALL